jgi:hypothetical protein
LPTTTQYLTFDTSVVCWVCHAMNKFTLSGCSESLMNNHSYTVQLLSLYNSTVSGPLALSFSCLWPCLNLQCLGLSRSSADGIQDTVHQGPIWCIRQPVAVETSRLIRCYSTALPFLGKHVCWFRNSYATAYCYNVTMEVPTPNTLPYISTQDCTSYQSISTKHHK